MSTPWFSPAPELEPKGLFNRKNLQAGAASIALPGMGHQMRDRFTIGIAWSIFSLAFYGALILFRVALDARLYRVTAIAVLLLSCAAVYDCCLRGKRDPVLRKLVFFLLAALVAAVWAVGASQGAALLAGLRYFDIPARSMAPTINVGDRILVDMRYYNYHKLQDGDVVVIEHHAPFPGAGAVIYLVKRVCGLAGETVQIRDGKLIRNGIAIEEPYVIHERPDHIQLEWAMNMPARTIPAGELFLLGDNRDNSFDSRYPEAGKFYESELRGKFVRSATFF